jgi:hypothetical protein
VTTRDWGNVWLNEGFATFMEYLWTEHHFGKDAADYERWQNAKFWNASHNLYEKPIVRHDFDDSSEFDGNAYDKGAWVLYMLRNQLGERAFFAALQHYLEVNRGKNVMTSDLVRSIDESTHTSVDQFFDQWVYGAGAPKFEVSYTYDGAKKQVLLTAKQTQKVEGHVGLFRVPVEVEVTNETGPKLFPIVVSKESETFTFPSQSAPKMVLFDKGSGDVLDQGKVYGEFDFSYLLDASAGTYTPRAVIGIGHRIEVGVNVNGIASPGPSQTTPTPTIKWKAYDGGKNGWALLFGNDVFIPVQNRSYDAGNYFYAEFTKTLKTQTCLTFGGFDFTSHVVASGNKAGGQFGIEQPAGKRVTLAADWLTGHQGAGYFTPGAFIKLSSKATAYTAYEIGNSGASKGNRLLLLELGWNFN